MTETKSRPISPRLRVRQRACEITETKRLGLQGGAVLLSPQAFSSTCSSDDTAACSAADKWPATLVFLAHLVLTLAHPSGYAELVVSQVVSQVVPSAP
jgi:hypothetical protein